MTVDDMEERIAALEAKIAKPHERLEELEAAIAEEESAASQAYSRQRAVNEALLNNILNDLGDYERSKYEEATVAALREALK